LHWPQLVGTAGHFIRIEVRPESHDKNHVAFRTVDRNSLHFVPENVHYMTRMHSTKSPMRRWPMAVMCNILDLVCVNAWILFNKETGRKISRRDFIHTLANKVAGPRVPSGPALKRRNCTVRKVARTIKPSTLGYNFKTVVNFLEEGTFWYQYLVLFNLQETCP